MRCVLSAALVRRRGTDDSAGLNDTAIERVVTRRGRVCEQEGQGVPHVFVLAICRAGLGPLNLPLQITFFTFRNLHGKPKVSHSLSQRRPVRSAENRKVGPCHGLAMKQ